MYEDPVRIRIRIDPPHPLVCRKRRLIALLQGEIIAKELSYENLLQNQPANFNQFHGVVMILLQQMYMFHRVEKIPFQQMY
jgi:hypothetical protein